MTDNVNALIATVPGSFQSEIGCTGDWAPDCLRSWLQDPDGDGLYSFSTSAIPAGDYEAKVAIQRDLGHQLRGGRRAKTAPTSPSASDADQTMTFRYDPATHVLDIFAEGGLEPGDELLVRPVLIAPVPGPGALLHHAGSIQRWVETPTIAASIPRPA